MTKHAEVETIGYPEIFVCVMFASLYVVMNNNKQVMKV